MLEKNFMSQSEIVNKFVDPSADYEMNSYDYVVRPNASAGAITITLPEVSQCKGRFYSIVPRDATNNITITDQGDSESWSGDAVLSNVGESAMFYSDGLKWTRICGYRVVRGETSITGSANVDTGLSHVIEAVACLGTDASLDAFGVNVTAISSGTVTMKVWKPTSSSDCTPAASTVATLVRWIAIGI